MRHEREIIVAPLITEKTSTMNKQAELEKKGKFYTFQVSVNANKIEIRHAIERIFEVNVVAVNTIRQKGKPKRLGRFSGRKPDWKKAVVKLKPGETISEFEV
jgi:large subunit ribosomal protein L23